MDNHFTILIPSYNVEPWVRKNLFSVYKQNYKNYDICYIDDCSTDETFKEAEKIFYKEIFNGNEKTLRRNVFNKGKMDNVYNAIKAFKEDTIVVLLDGDDWLYDHDVLKKLNNIYTEDVWMTNGSYIVHPIDQIVCPQINTDYWIGNIRKKSWQFSHLGTFRKKLFDKIKRKDFMSKKGEFYHTTSDQAIMWPIAEMSGPEHFIAVNETLYTYNRTNPLADDVVNRKDQLETEQEIRNKKPYERLKNL